MELGWKWTEICTLLAPEPWQEACTVVSKHERERRASTELWQWGWCERDDDEMRNDNHGGKLLLEWKDDKESLNDFYTRWYVCVSEKCFYVFVNTHGVKFANINVFFI